MFSYNPGVYDQSGQILADSTTRAAAVNAQMLNDLGKNVGSGMKKAASAAIGFATGGPAGAAMAVKNANQENGGGFLDAIVNSYAKREQDKSDAKIYGNLMKIIAPAFGKEGDGILQQFNGLESDAERAEFGRTIAQSLGTIGNMYAQTRSAGIRQDQQALTAALPDLRNRADAEADVAAGNAPYRASNRPRGVIPGASAATTPMPVISQNPNVFQQARMPFAGMSGSR